MATPASSAWHRRRILESRSPSDSIFGRGSLERGQSLGPTVSKNSFPQRCDSAANSVLIASKKHVDNASSPLSSLRWSHGPLHRADFNDATPLRVSPSEGAREHVVLVKAAQAGAILFTFLALLFPILVIMFASCDWPRATLARPAVGLVVYVQAMVRLLAGLAVVLSVILFHGVTLSNFDVVEHSRTLRPRTVLFYFSSGPALRHLLAMAISGAVQVPSFAILCHGFSISRKVRSRVAPSWSDLELLLLTGTAAGIAFSCVWHSRNGYLLRVSPNREPWRLRVIHELYTSFNLALVPFLLSSAIAVVLSFLVPTEEGLSKDPEMLATVVEGASPVTVDFSGLRRFWICIEAVSLSVSCWVLSSSIVSILLTQPYDFVLESTGRMRGSKSSSSNHSAAGNPRHGRKVPDSIVLDRLLFALNARVRLPSADPTGILGALALQDLCDNVSATPSSRGPVFADPRGVVWNDVLGACLRPVDKLSWRLWMRANSHKLRSDLPTVFQSVCGNGSNLHQTEENVREREEPSRALDAIGYHGRECDVPGADAGNVTIFGEKQQILHATEALSNFLVASRVEDRYGVAQRTIVDILTCLLQCHEKLVALNGSELLRTQSVLSGSGHSETENFAPGKSLELDDARQVEASLVHAMRLIVDAFHEHLRGYVDGQEPRWTAKFNASLALFLQERG